MALVEIRDLAVEIAGRKILHDVSFEIERGEIVTLIGPNGAGKSSLVRAIIGVIEPVEGQILRATGLKIGYVPQNLQAMEIMPMNVERFLRGAGNTHKTQRKTLIEKYGIASLLRKPLARLSGGEMRRVLFAHALMDAPDLLILDEPTAGLDVSATTQFYKYIQGLANEENLAILLVSHDLNVVMRASNRVICLNGHICCQGAPMDVSRAPEYMKTMGVFDPVAFYEHHHDHTHEH